VGTQHRPYHPGMALTSLLVCADAQAVPILSGILSDLGIQTEACGDPQQALARLKTQAFDALLVDCENEPDALDLIVAARKSTSNQSTLVIALVDGSNGLREVFAKGLDSVRISLRDAVLSIAALAGYTTLTGIDVFLARHFLAPVAAGRYAAAAIAGHIALFLPGALVTVAFPRLVSANATGISARKTLTETVGLVTFIGLAAFAVLAGIPGVVVDVLFGPNYLGAASIVGIIALTSVLLGVIGLLTYFHVARRSVAALYSWAGVALVWVLVAVLHGGVIAEIGDAAQVIGSPGQPYTRQLISDTPSLEVAIAEVGLGEAPVDGGPGIPVVPAPRSGAEESAPAE